MNVFERLSIVLFSIFIVGSVGLSSVSALSVDDSDGDGLSDSEEIEIFGTNPHNRDTDSDGYSDREEIEYLYSPRDAKKRKLTELDSDNDKLNDAFELAFGTDIHKMDSDGDGFSDWKELVNGYDPRTPELKRVEKKIVITIAKQRLSYYIDGIRLEETKVSTGKWNTPTPIGTYEVGTRTKKAWSKLAGLWMPYWMGLKGKGIKTGDYGIHELPVWPSGYREGEHNLGVPVSHGCIRLGVQQAKKIYELTPIGTQVTIKK